MEKEFDIDEVTEGDLLEEFAKVKGILRAIILSKESDKPNIYEEWAIRALQDKVLDFEGKLESYLFSNGNMSDLISN